MGLENFDDLPKSLQLAKVSYRDLLFLKGGQSPPGKDYRSMAFDVFQGKRGRSVGTASDSNKPTGGRTGMDGCQSVPHLAAWNSQERRRQVWVFTRLLATGIRVLEELG